jgi:hypothetical protein
MTDFVSDRLRSWWVVLGPLFGSILGVKSGRMWQAWISFPIPWTLQLKGLDSAQKKWKRTLINEAAFFWRLLAVSLASQVPKCPKILNFLAFKTQFFGGRHALTLCVAASCWTHEVLEIMNASNVSHSSSICFVWHTCCSVVCRVYAKYDKQKWSKM